MARCIAKNKSCADQNLEFLQLEDFVPRAASPVPCRQVISVGIVDLNVKEVDQKLEQNGNTGVVRKKIYQSNSLS